MKNDALGDRMKGYENISRIYLTRRMPLIIRIDGKAFHSFTRGFARPFDPIFMNAMRDTAMYLCNNIMGCKLAYTQSDEISLLVTDYDQINTDPWFGKNLQKIVSVAASMATMAFNRYFDARIEDAVNSCNYGEFYYETYGLKIGTAMFDARAFVLPKEEVCNYFIWRQQDAIRNSIQAVGQAFFSHKDLDHKSQNDIRVMLKEQKDVDWWENYTPCEKLGSCVTKTRKETIGEDSFRMKWEHDLEIPVFSKDRNYIERFVLLGEE